MTGPSIGGLGPSYASHIGRTSLSRTSSNRQQHLGETQKKIYLIAMCVFFVFIYVIRYSRAPQRHGGAMGGALD